MAPASAAAAAAFGQAIGRPPTSRSVPTPTDAPWAFAEDEAGFEFRVAESTLLEDMGLVKALEGLDAIRARRDDLEAWARDESVLPAGPAGLLICTRAHGRADEYDVAEVLDSRRAANGEIELKLRGPAEWRPLTRWLALEFVSNVPNHKLACTVQMAAWRHLKEGYISRLSCGAVTSHAQRLRRCIQAAGLPDDRAARAVLSYDFAYDAGDARLLSDLGFLPTLSALESLHLRPPQLFAWSSSLPHEASLLLPDGPIGLLVKVEQPYAAGLASSRSVVCEVVLADARSRRLTIKGPANWRPLERQISFDEVLDEPLRDEDLITAWHQLRSRHLSDVELPPVIHVAGTNGKGSTIAFIRAGLEAAGCSVHVYTSPHLVRFHERIRLAGRLIGEPTLATLLAEVLAAIGDESITFFEATTCAALLAFSRVPADYTLLEVGMGGRLDATNVAGLAPVACVITAVSLDHQEFLGSTVEAIAAEKAGILRAGVPAVVAPQTPGALSVIRARAATVGCPLPGPGADPQAGRAPPLRIVICGSLYLAGWVLLDNGSPESDELSDGAALTSRL
ncbi:folc bifunctional protein [Chrysochromulina tobinii]|uniref:Folc bifunctional protein n=1 Tax=Chrysochromulina tobinii TaxID=1460289 RepID=A0A0M0JFU7_9EUKA|nr:folc bifunctional protein [Chrysochromulina tobinii]|eukprot:KOO25113.1 folc bifunctional protein [Chrysochromulina sp. CCMP291]